jgi:hypothetical protein
MSDDIDLDWLEEFRQTANNDQELSVIGEWFTTTFSVNFGAQRVAFKVNGGKIEEIVRDPRFDIRAIFGFSAPLEVWKKFFQPIPPPLYHDFFAMIMRIPEFVLEGDGLVAMQNARALHRTMSLMRQVGAEHV